MEFATRVENPLDAGSPSTTAMGTDPWEEEKASLAEQLELLRRNGKTKQLVQHYQGSPSDTVERMHKKLESMGLICALMCTLTTAMTLTSLERYDYADSSGRLTEAQVHIITDLFGALMGVSSVCTLNALVFCAAFYDSFNAPTLRCAVFYDTCAPFLIH